MNQIETIRQLVVDYLKTGASTDDIGAVVAYINEHKPAGIGRVNEVICAAILQQIKTPDKISISQATITMPEKERERPLAIYSLTEKAKKPGFLKWLRFWKKT